MADAPKSSGPESVETGERLAKDHGDLPAWSVGDLPEPLEMSFRNIIRTIGPGAILLAGSIGGGEWIVGPLATVRYGTEILWVATVGIFLQMIFNLEAIRYTLYCGEPVVTGIMRLHPGSKFWGLFYVFVGFAQLATPAMALSCANVLLTAGMGRLPDAGGGDRFPLMWISWGVLLLTVVLLQSGKSIEKVLERLSWGMVIFIFVFLLLANALFVPMSTSWKTLKGFFTPVFLLWDLDWTSWSDWKSTFGTRLIPPNMNWALLGVFAATAGSGGLGNLAISNWTRDKGLGMGRWMGSIGGALADSSSEVRPIGVRFLPTADNLRRWAIWWKYSLLDQSVLWAIGCVAGMYLNVNLAQAIVTPDNIPADNAAGAFQAAYMAEKLWSGFWVLALVNGFWILFSTQLGNTDCLTRVSADVLWAGFPQLRSMRTNRIYLYILLALSVWGVGILAIGKSAFELFQYLGLIANPILAIGAVQILRVNTRFLPREIQPPLWRRVCLVACAVIYGVLAAVSIYSKIFSV